MNGARGRCGIAVVLLLPALASASDAALPPLTMSQYIARLDTLVSAVAEDGGDGSPRSSILLRELPRTWIVDGSTRTFEIPADSLRLELRAWTTSHDGAARRRLLDHLRTLRTDAALFEQPAPDVAAERLQLARILERPEFQNVHGPTWLDRLERRALELLGRVLSRVVRSSDIPAISSMVVYALITIAVLMVARSIGRAVRRSPATAAIALGVPAMSTREWSLWLADAQAAAARGDWRDAVHRTYWCAVSFLEAKGAWRPDRARTPREYLRLLPTSASGGDALAKLTQRCEVVWYGTAPADAHAFTESIENLKQIGCPVA
jgi:hypothetical protein